MIPPASRMGPLTDAELRALLATPQVKKYATAVDRESARGEARAEGRSAHGRARGPE